MATENELELENNRLRKEIEKLKSSQSGSDRSVQRLLARVAELEGAQFAHLDGEKAGKTPPEATSTDERERALARRERVFQLAVEKGIEPQKAFTLLGLNGTDESETLDSIIDYSAEIERKTRTEVLRENGRSPARPRLEVRASSLEEINRLPDAQILALPGDSVKRALHAYADEQKGEKKTVRNGILSRLLGAK